MTQSSPSNKVDQNPKKGIVENIGIDIGEKSPEVSNQPTLSEKFAFRLSSLLHWRSFPLLVIIIVALVDILLGLVEGMGIAISALEAEGTLTLALVTYLQMRLSQKPPSH